MSARCPYIGLEGNRTQVYLTDNPRHRCYATGLPQRVAGAHQGTICLTSGYRRCPRFRTASARQELLPGEREEVRDLAPGRTGAARGSQALASDVTVADRPRYTDVRPAPRRLWGSGRWRWPTRTEGAVAGLMACIVCAIIFVGYGVLSRVQVWPGIPAPAIARLAGRTASSTPTSMVALVPPTSMPALEPTGAPSAEPVATSAEATLSPPRLATVTAPPTPTVPATSVPTREPTPESQTRPAPTPVEATLPPPTSPPEPTPTPEAHGRPLPANAPPTRLVLPGIKLNVPVRPVKAKKVGEGANAETVWEELPNAAGFHDTSAYPGNPGNTVINGHRESHAAVFRNLDQVQVGDEILLYVGPAAYPYRVAEIVVLPETSATPAQKAEKERLIGYLPEERLTLTTRTPVGLATHRLLVIARPSE